MKVILTRDGKKVKEFPYVNRVIVNSDKTKYTELRFHDTPLMIPLNNPALNEQLIIEEE